MPSLVNISKGETTENSEKEKCFQNDIILNADTDVGTTTGRQVQTDDSDLRPSKSPCTEVSDENKPSTTEGEDVIIPVNTKGMEETDESSSSSAPSPNSKKRRVTPTGDSGIKKKQQKVVNHMSLSSFFFQRSENITTTSTPSKIVKAMAKSGNSDVVIPRVTSTVKNSSSIPTSENDTPDKNRDCELDIVTDQPQNDKSAKVKPDEKEVTRKIIPSEGETRNSPSTKINLDHETEKSPRDTQAVSLETKIDSDSVSTTTTRIDPTELAFETENPSDVAQSAPSTSSVRTKNKNSKRSNTRKGKKSESTENSKSPESLASVTKKKLSEGDLTKESYALLQKYRKMKKRYLERASEITCRHKDGLDEEEFGTVKLLPLSEDTKLKMNDSNLCEEFPTEVVANMASLIEGSGLPLSKLVSKICHELQCVHKIVWSAEAISSKVKLVSKRKAYFDPIRKSSEIVDLFEDNNKDRLWRWEVTTLDILNSDINSKARKARTARKKISSYQLALLKLVKSLEEIEKQILNPALPKLEKAKAKISRDEEKVLKFERDAERQRLAEESRARKLLEQEAKKKAKEEASEAKRRKKEEATEKKKEAAQAREDEKRKREEEKLLREAEKKREEKKKQEKAFKQKASFRSFFAAPKKENKDHQKANNSNNACTNGIDESFDAKLFRSQIDASSGVFRFTLKGQKRSESAIASRKHRTKTIAVSVYKTVASDDAEWGAPDYLEQTMIKIPNKYRFLSFHEDCRAAYHGTWTKKSLIVTGKTPFAKDSSIFDYEYDSEAEWEEGDDEIGENVEDDTKNQEEDMDGDGNAKMYDFEDGFCVADDRLLDNEEDADEETKALYKKKMCSRQHEQHMHSNRIRIIAPGFGGVPLNLTDPRNLSADYVEGFETGDVNGVLSSYKSIQLANPNFCIDAFPQLQVNEENCGESTTNANTNKNDYSAEAMVAMVRFSHHSTHTSKDKLIEELRTLHPTQFSNRAKAIRKLDAISVKKKHPKFAGVYWEVKKEILTELCLTDIMEMKVEDIVYDSTVPEKVSTPGEGSKPKDDPKGKEHSARASKKNKANGANSQASGAVTKKRKTTAKTGSGQKSTDKKKADEKNKSLNSVSKSNGEKVSPKKDVCAGMKNLMAQFIKRSPVNATSRSSKDVNSSSSSSSSSQ